MKIIQFKKGSIITKYFNNITLYICIYDSITVKHCIYMESSRLLCKIQIRLYLYAEVHMFKIGQMSYMFGSA